MVIGIKKFYNKRSIELLVYLKKKKMLFWPTVLISLSLRTGDELFLTAIKEKKYIKNSIKKVCALKISIERGFNKIKSQNQYLCITRKHNKKVVKQIKPMNYSRTDFVLTNCPYLLIIQNRWGSMLFFLSTIKEIQKQK